jgi:hypothetical protein
MLPTYNGVQTIRKLRPQISNATLVLLFAVISFVLVSARKLGRR